MKFQGKKIDGPKPEFIVIPRGENIEDAVIFKAEAVLDYAEFNQLCPEPKPPTIMYRDGRKVLDTNDPKFKQSIDRHAERRMAWMVLKSLRNTPDLEWETVDYNNPETWMNYRKELEETFTQYECTLIIGGVMSANSMNEERMKQARETFLRSQAAPSAE